MSLRICALAMAVTGLLAGCGTGVSDQGLREFDLRSASGYEYFSADRYMSLPDMQHQLFLHRDLCAAEIEFKKDPRQVHFATIYYGPANQGDLKDKVLLDLTAYASGKTAITAYGYKASNKQLARDVLRVLADPSFCPQGIAPKTK